MKIGSFEVIGKSGSIRRKIFDFIPFWQNSKVRFLLTFKALSDTQQEAEFVYFIRYPNREESEYHDIKIPPMKARQSRSYTTAPFIMWYTGDAFLNVGEGLPSTPVYGTPVYAFHVTDRSWMGLAILAGILAGAFTTLGSWILSLIK